MLRTVFMLTILVLLAVGLAEGMPVESVQQPFFHQMVRGPHGSYGFSYFTLDGKAHYETRDTQGVVRGRYSYYVLGKKVVVNYIADAMGFRVLEGNFPGTVDNNPLLIQG